MSRVFSILLILIGSSNAAALPEPINVADALILQAEAKGLAHHSYWMALMHYRQNAKNQPNEVTSEIISSEFFLSPVGNKDSASELAATIKPFFKDPGTDPDSHAQCRFIARYKWLRKTLNWDGILPPAVTCNQYNEWAMSGHVDSLSMVFATGYLSNPASLYGHILLKFNTNRSIIPSEILDESVNFGAIIPRNENGVIYVFKGLFGGYDASFSSTRFFRINHMYAESELRDMWEYELALNKDEIDQIISHSWELLKVRFKYYFLKENCAYQMAKLLELVIRQPLLPRDMPWSLPVTVFNRLASLERNGVPLVRKVRLIPSRLNNFYAKYAALTPSQKLLANELVIGKSDFGKADYSALSEPEKVTLVDTLLDYYEFRIVSDAKDTDLRKSKQNLLIQRSVLASQTSSTNESSSREPDTTPPHEGQFPGLTRMGLFQNSRLGTGMELRFRPAYYDFLQPDVGHVANSNLTMFDFRTIYANNRLTLRSLDLVDIESLNVSRTRLPGDGGLAWNIKLGFKNQDLGCQNCMTFNFSGGIGKAAPITSNITTYGMIDLFAQTQYLDSGTLGAITRIGLIGSPVIGWKSNFTIGQRVYTNGSLSNRRSISWENRFGTSRNWDIRISYNDEAARELQTAISIYW
jgi:hypothetical protein